MTRPAAPHPTSVAATTSDPRRAALLLAAEAVLACLHPRAPLRITAVSLRSVPGVTYALDADPQALASNRALREEVALVALAQAAMARLLGQDGPAAGTGRDARALLESALADPEEREVVAAQITVLEARARAALRRAWAEVEVVAAGLVEHGSLDAQEVAHRIRCAQGIRGTLLN